MNIKNVKVFAIVEQTIQPPVDLEEIRRQLKAGKFRGEVHVNHNQGGITSVVTREKIPLTMQELDQVLKSR